ncbi:MAG: phosphatase PAP2 family protein [Flavipsychrobacter sp.]
MGVSKPYSSYNSYFLIPFFIWVLVGAVFQFYYTQEELFKVINLNHSPVLDVAMSSLTLLGEGVVTTIILLSLFAFKRFRNWWYFIAALACNILPSILTQIVKSYVGAPRPLKFFAEAQWIHILPHWQHAFERSFPSGHTTAAFCFFTFISFLLPQKYKAIGVVFLLLALSTAYSRVYLAVHFFEDVYIGSIIGVLFTTFIISLMNKYQAVFFKKNK